MPVAVKTAPTASTIHVAAGFAVDLVAVIIPPCEAAFIATKGFRFAVRLLRERLTAVFTKVLFLFCAEAEGFYRIDRQAERLANQRVADAYFA
jgi:hypothetical protein